jgi:hypothetical protein
VGSAWDQLLRVWTAGCSGYNEEGLGEKYSDVRISSYSLEAVKRF